MTEKEEPGMKLSKTIAAVAVVTCVAFGGLIGGFVASAQTATTTPKPEIDRANATIGLQGQLKVKECGGEDSISYETYTGKWLGSESQIVPDPTDYPLSGALTVSGIKWTINLSTARGLWTSKIVLTNAAGVVTYSGTMTLVTQGIPTAGTAPTSGRGWIYAPVKLPDEAAAAGDDSVVANVEFPSLTTVGGSGFFGDLSGGPAVPDFSVVTNVFPATNNEYCGAP
jgi:hypothetical protein